MTVLCLAYPHQHGFKAHHPFKVYGERREGRFDATHLYVAYSSAFGSFHMSPRNGQHPCIFLTTNTSPLTCRTLSTFLYGHPRTLVELQHQCCLILFLDDPILLFGCLQRNPPRRKYLYAFFRTLCTSSFGHKLFVVIELNNLPMCSDSPSYSLSLKALSNCTPRSSTYAWPS